MSEHPTQGTAGQAAVAFCKNSLAVAAAVVLLLACWAAVVAAVCWLGFVAIPDLREA
jgi:hypothetical protein